MKRLPSSHFDGALILLHICQLCNYAQFGSERVRCHLIDQHNIPVREAQIEQHVTVVDCMRLDLSPFRRESKLLDIYSPTSTSLYPATNKTVNCIENMGFSMFQELIKFCCLIDDCVYESPSMSELGAHLSQHKIVWSGYCCMCEKQVS